MDRYVGVQRMPEGVRSNDGLERISAAADQEI
jgi:hypothetical protein